jgi:hypothetical protein
MKAVYLRTVRTRNVRVPATDSKSDESNISDVTCHVRADLLPLPDLAQLLVYQVYRCLSLVNGKETVL